METYSQTVQSEPPLPHSGDLAPQFLSSELPALPSSPFTPKLWSQLSPVSCELSFWGGFNVLWELIILSCLLFYSLQYSFTVSLTGFQEGAEINVSIQSNTFHQN